MSDQNAKIMLSGVKPTGRPHLGNYFGAMRQFAALQEEYHAFVMIADYHALTTVRVAKELKQDTLDVAIDYLAIGLDPAKAVLFKQSDVPEHTELAWIFNCLTTMPYLMRAHAFKDAEARSKEVSVGVFDYPLLMAADILLYDAAVVPVGQDQKQHLEIARDTAEKFNHLYGETFKLPTPYILDQVKTVPGTDGQKMSKSYGNTIPLFATTAEIEEAVMSIKTDSKGVEEPKDPETDTVFALHRLVTPASELSELENKYRQGGIGYKEAKGILIESLENFIAPLRAKRAQIAANPDDVIAILKNGGATARDRAKLKMEDVRRKIGVDL